MRAGLSIESVVKKATLEITGSKSESNRLLILQALYPQIDIQNRSNSHDTQVLAKALSSEGPEIDIHHAGTAMRFLTAYFAFKNEENVILTGSERMQQRPIKILVDALRHLGADVEYLKEDGFPPLSIKGTKPSGNEVSLEAHVSSQYISALLLVAPSFQNGLQIHLKSTLTSAPYVKMTLSLLEGIGVSYRASESTIEIQPLSQVEPTTYTIESDWSSVSYLYSWVAIAEKTSLMISHYKSDSLQGDRALVELFEPLGVQTTFIEENNSLLLEKKPVHNPKIYTCDLSETPDIAQTLAVTCFALGIAAEFTGLHTLKIKETDRLLALEIELKKLGADISVTDNSLSLAARDLTRKVPDDVSIATYQDHRMAMAFAPLALCCTLNIEEPMVVEKSYPTFWNDMQTLGMKVTMEESTPK